MIKKTSFFYVISMFCGIAMAVFSFAFKMSPYVPLPQYASYATRDFRFAVMLHHDTGPGPVHPASVAGTRPTRRMWAWLSACRRLSAAWPDPNGASCSRQVTNSNYTHNWHRQREQEAQEKREWSVMLHGAEFLGLKLWVCCGENEAPSVTGNIKRI